MENFNYKKYIEKTTKKTSFQQQKLLKSFAKLDIDQQLIILENKNSLFHKIRSKNNELEKKSIFAFIALIISIDEFIVKLNNIEKNLIKFKYQKIEKNRKKEKLLQFWSIVKKLKKNENMSFRNISNYLRKYHKFDISYSLIYQKWNEIEGRI